MSIMRTPRTDDLPQLALMLFVAVAVAFAGPVRGQALFQGSLSCPAFAPTGQQIGDGLLGALVDPAKGNALNAAWAQAEPKIETQQITLDHVHIPGGCSAASPVCAAHAASCSFVYANINVHALKGLNPLRFTQLASAAEGVNQRNVAAHTNRGPDASVITDGVFAAEGHDATDTAYAIVLPHNGVNGGLVIDLGSNMSICGVTSGCTAPKIQADNDDIYQLDYSPDGKTWSTFAQFSKTGGSGLHSRLLTSDNTLATGFTARYVRISGISGGSTYSVSELQLWNSGNQLVSVGRPTAGPMPYQIVDDHPAPNGTSATDANYSVVLTHKPGSATALMVDLGKVAPICGSRFESCGHEPTIQADNDDTYMFDYSIDGKNWTTYGHADENGDWHGTFASVGGNALQTRDMNCSARPDPDAACSQGNDGAAFSARYVRVFARSGGDTFAVSQLQLWDTAGNPVFPATYTPQAYGPEPFFVNGEFAPEGTAWNDVHYVTKLGSCTLNSSSRCPVAAAKTAAPISSALQVDLTAQFSISRLAIQADQNDTYQVDGSADGVSWTGLWTVPTVSQSGLRTRVVTLAGGSTPFRYLRVYATAGDGNYSVAELQVLTRQGNTAGAYAGAEDSAGFTFYDGRANDGQNFACSYDGPFTTALGVAGASSVQPLASLPISFYVDSVALKVYCTNGTEYTLAAANGRACSMTLVPPAAYAPPFTDAFQAGYCAPTSTAPQGQPILSYIQFDQNPDASESYSAIQFAAKDDVTPSSVSDLQCTDFDSLDAHIPDLLRGLVPQIAAGATKSAINQALDYHASPIVPFPRDTSKPQPYPPFTCAGALTVGAPPVAAPSDIGGLSGRATQVGSGNDNATLHIGGTFRANRDVALDQAAITFDALLQEIGVGELVQRDDAGLLVPMTLEPANGSTPDKGIYRSPPGASPKVSARIDLQRGSMRFDIDVERATIQTPASCQEGSTTALLKTSFMLGGGSAEPIWTHATAQWQCRGDRLQTP